MSKYACLVIEAEDGTLESLAGSSSVPLIALAKQIRATGRHGKALVVGGVVLTSWTIGPVYSFRVSKPQPVAPAEKPAKAAKG